MRIRWTAAAAADLQNISDVLKERGQQYTRRSAQDLGRY